MESYTTSLQHILAELERVDLFIQVQVRRARQVQKFNDEFQGIHIPEQEVDALLTQHAGLPRWTTVPMGVFLPEGQATFDEISATIAQRKAESAQRHATP